MSWWGWMLLGSAALVVGLLWTVASLGRAPGIMDDGYDR